MTCRLRPEGAEDAGQGSEREDVSGVESIPQGPEVREQVGGTFCWGSGSFCSLLHRPG